MGPPRDDGGALIAAVCEDCEDRDVLCEWCPVRRDPESFTKQERHDRGRDAALKIGVFVVAFIALLSLATSVVVLLEVRADINAHSTSLATIQTQTAEDHKTIQSLPPVNYVLFEEVVYLNQCVYASNQHQACAVPPDLGKLFQKALHPPKK
jgi:hypothetical protein